MAGRDALAAGLQRQFGFERNPRDLCVLADDCACANGRPREAHRQGSRLNDASGDISHDAHRAIGVGPGQHLLGRGAAMLDFPAPVEDEIAIDTLLGDHALQSRDAGIHFIEGTCGGALQHDASGAATGAVGNQSGFVNCGPDSPPRQMKRGRRAGQSASDNRNLGMGSPSAIWMGVESPLLEAMAAHPN